MPLDEQTRASLADLMGAPIGYVHFEGKDYPVREPSVDEMVLFGAWLKRRALESVARAVYLPDEAQERLYSVAVEMLPSAFEYHSKAGYAALATPEGRAKILQLTLSPEHPEVTEEFALRMVNRCGDEMAAVMMTGGSPSHPKAECVLRTLRLPSDFLSSPYATHLSTLLAERSDGSPQENSSTSSASGERTAGSPTSPTSGPGAGSGPPATSTP